jgi:transposase
MLPYEERLKLRQEQSAPVLAQLRERLLAWKEQLLPKHPMAEAVNYALSQWAELNVFCFDGAVSIDNNVSEREMKRVVLNRKNSLFVGNPRGGRTAAILASLTSTCRRHDVDPQLYLTQLLTNLSQVRKPNCATGSRTSGTGSCAIVRGFRRVLQAPRSGSPA